MLSTRWAKLCCEHAPARTTAHLSEAAIGSGHTKPNSATNPSQTHGRLVPCHNVSKCVAAATTGDSAAAVATSTGGSSPAAAIAMGGFLQPRSHDPNPITGHGRVVAVGAYSWGHWRRRCYLPFCRCCWGTPRCWCRCSRQGSVVPSRPRCSSRDLCLLLVFPVW
jgi:hypothetical protein